ncbi:MAG: FTR1 family protein [Bacteroidetes bacterium]|nr:FTR1 family protein [Bacteroidota bacterium]
MAEFLILFREGLEIVLILGIVLTWLHKQGRMADARWVAWGSAVAVLVSLLAGLGLAALQDNAAAKGYDKLVEALMLYIACAFILYLVVWMGRVANPAAGLHKQLNEAASPRALFLIALLAVAREGIESVTFLFAARSAAGTVNWLGVFLGLAVALVLGYLIFWTGRKLPLKRFFMLSNATLILLAAGMSAYGTHELEEFLVDQKVIAKPTRAWEVLKPVKADELPAGETGGYTCKDGKCYHPMHEKGTAGVFFKTFLGWNSDPNYAEPIVWVLVLALGIWLWRKPTQKGKAPPKPAGS